MSTHAGGGAFSVATRRLDFISVILVFVRAAWFSAILLLAFGATLLALAGSGQTPQQPPSVPSPPAPQGTPPAAQAQPPAPPAKPGLSVVVLDPAHGGADAGARGASGVLESEVVLSLASQVRAELERQGLRVLMTRQGNDNPSFDDRAAVTNAQRGAIFISFHVSSTGPVGTARAYSMATSPPQVTRPGAAAQRSGLVSWDQAQANSTELSRRLAELVQVQLAQKFRGSAEVPTLAAVRQLRTIAAPAIAIEISSVSVPNRAPLEQMAPALAEALARSVAAFRSIYEAGAK